MNIIKWLESEEGEKWSRAHHVCVKHHAIIEDWEDLPVAHNPEFIFADYNGEPYTELATCECLGGTTVYLQPEAWRCSRKVLVPGDWCDMHIPYNPDLRF